MSLLASTSVGDLVNPAVESMGFGREVLNDPIRKGDLLPLAKGSGRVTKDEKFRGSPWRILIKR